MSRGENYALTMSYLSSALSLSHMGAVSLPQGLLFTVAQSDNGPGTNSKGKTDKQAVSTQWLSDCTLNEPYQGFLTNPCQSLCSHKP